MTRLGGLIKAKRESEGLSLRDFSERCQLSHSYIKNLEDGDPRTGKQIVPTIESLEKISSALGMSLEDLLKEIGYIEDRERKQDLKDLCCQNAVNVMPHIKDEELLNFIADPENEEYLQLAKDLQERKIKVKFIRNTFFDE